MEKWLLGDVLQKHFLENFKKFTEKYLCQSLQRCSVKRVFLTTLQNLQENTYVRISFLIKMPKACNFIKKVTLAPMFSANLAKFLRTPSPTEHLRQLLLFLIPLNAFRPSGFQLYQRETPALVFQSHAFLDPLQNKCS